jgi:DNA-binding phage protein
LTNFGGSSGPEAVKLFLMGLVMAKKMTTYQRDLIAALKNPHEAVAYLNTAMEEHDRALFLLALRNVAEAHIGKVNKALS